MKFFFDTLLKFMVNLANLWLIPVNTLVSNAFPSFASLVTQCTNLINTYLGNGLAYFFSILPPNTRYLVLLYLSILIICYGIMFSIHVLIKAIILIRNIKVW